uniref:Transmembrane protein 177 n=1 Tax=Acrobeloides nanus TaxID=290746 RepID=A0A914DUF3_9BILA
MLLSDEIPSEFWDKFESECIYYASKHKREMADKQINVCLIGNMEPRTEGTLIGNIKTAKFHLPARAAYQNLTELRKKFPNLLELVAEYQLKDEYFDTKEIPNNILSNFLLSDNALRFLFSQQLTRANSLNYVLLPLYVSVPITMGGFLLQNVFSKIIGLNLAFACFSVLTIYAIYTVSKVFYEYYECALDTQVFSLGEDYVKGAAEYWESSMRMGAYIRSRLGNKVKHIWHKSGDLTSHYIPYSQRQKRLREWIQMNARTEI